MVVKLIGKVNGQNIVFNHKEGDVWETVIPKNLSGIYIVELTAYDEAGNKGYTSKYLVTINTKYMTVSLKRMAWAAEFKENIYKTSSKVSQYYGEVKDFNYKFCAFISSYYAKLIE